MFRDIGAAFQTSIVDHVIPCTGTTQTLSSGEMKCAILELSLCSCLEAPVDEAVHAIECLWASVTLDRQGKGAREQHTLALLEARRSCYDQ